MKKKEYNFEFILTIVKYIFGILTHSIGLFSESLFNISTILKGIAPTYSKNKKDSKVHNIYNVIVGALIVLMGLCLILNIFTEEIFKVKWYVVIICLISILFYNGYNSIIYTKNYDRKELAIVKTSRNYMATMVISYIVLIGYILTLFSKYISVLKYADALVGLLISIYTILVGLKYIFINFKGMEEDTFDDTVISPLVNRYQVIHSINKINILKYGSSYKLIIDISLEKDADRIKTYPVLLDISSCIFKKCSNIEIIEITKSPIVEKKRVVKRARNSRSRNSKKNTTKKNTKKKNKKN